MLRIVKLRSPMSTGSWAIFLFGNLGGLIAVHQAAEDGLLGRGVLSRLGSFIPGRALSVIALPFGLFVGAYTGILLAATSVPVWARNWLLMGPTFLASGVSNGLSALSFILHLGNWGEEKTLGALRRAERLTLIMEALLISASLVKMGRWGKPLFSKKLAPLFLGGTMLGGIVAPLALLSGKETRSRGLLASALVLLGGFMFRYVMVVGERMSADDPEAYSPSQRSKTLLSRRIEPKKVNNPCEQWSRSVRLLWWCRWSRACRGGKITENCVGSRGVMVFYAQGERAFRQRGGQSGHRPEASDRGGAGL